MGILIAVAVGLIAGVLARLVMPGRDPGGLLVTTLLGVIGATVAWFLGTVVGWYEGTGEGPGVVAAVVGALLVLALYRAFARDRELT